MIGGHFCCRKNLLIFIHRKKIESAIPIVREMVNDGLVIVTEVTVVKYGKELTEADN